MGFIFHEESIFQTRLPEYYCEWRNGAESGDVYCLCKKDGCNTAGLLDQWILNGQCGKACTKLRNMLSL